MDALFSVLVAFWSGWLSGPVVLMRQGLTWGGSVVRVYLRRDRQPTSLAGQLRSSLRSAGEPALAVHRFKQAKTSGSVMENAVLPQLFRR